MPMEREMHFVARYRVQHMRQLFWGYRLGVWLVLIDQAGNRICSCPSAL